MEHCDDVAGFESVHRSETHYWEVVFGRKLAEVEEMTGISPTGDPPMVWWLFYDNGRGSKPSFVAVSAQVCCPSFPPSVPSFLIHVDV